MQQTQQNRPPKTETVSAFARRLGVHRSTAGRWVASGLPRAPDGRVKIAPALRWLATRRPTSVHKGRGIARAQQQTPAGIALERARKQKLAAQADLAGYQADRAELELGIVEGSLLEFREVDLKVFETLRACRDRIQNIPDRIVAQVFAEYDSKRRLALIRAEVRVAMSVLDTWSP